MASGCDHVAIAAEDPRALASWYCEAFGLRVLFDNEQEPPTYLVGGDAGGMIEIMPHRSQPRPQREFYAPGISHIALTVGDFEAASARLREMGVTLADPVPAAGGGQLANFADPEGNALQIIARTRDLR